ncbi:hypothetical protein B0J13DRAFT_664440 [Dactylonectria estremocensis]|uniref:Uncharacterized protein n=1 Tax=Dactylonectria estremocensis TaxID=1079267 RepID=A0A9P9EYE8_9HYPO|nr:hypothetical protein B0J13DRAFT_664440 [Dactylonectria estremocensis]
MRNGGPLEPIKRYLVKGVAGSIGLASESYTTYQEGRNTTPRTAGTEDGPSEPNNNDQHGNEDEDKDRGALVRGEELVRDEEALWELDATQDEILPPRALEQDTEVRIDEQAAQRHVDALGKSLAERYPPPVYNEARPELPIPVVLPQRRPKSRQRGFIRAYAPVLDDCSISQGMFLDFLETFHKSSQASPWFIAINIAVNVLTFTPHLPMIVGIALQASVMVAEDIQGRTRTNSFLDKANADFFRPRGLFCLILTYNPDAAEGRKQSSVPLTIATSLNPAGMGKIKHKLRSSSGEIEFPESAPLIFPALDELDEQQSQEAKTKRAQLSGAKRYVDEYYDKRAQAQFTAEHPDSTLAQVPQPTFTSRYADPNHPASSGSFRSLVTGGYINPPPMTRSRFGGLRGRRRGGLQSLAYLRRGNDVPDDELHRVDVKGAANSQAQGGVLGNAGGIVKKALKKNVLYLMVVNMPSDEELADAMAEIERQKKSGFKLPSIRAKF